jgi:hypothetical protein
LFSIVSKGTLGTQKLVVLVLLITHPDGRLLVWQTVSMVPVASPFVFLMFLALLVLLSQAELVP